MNVYPSCSFILACGAPPHYPGIHMRSRGTAPLQVLKLLSTRSEGLTFREIQTLLDLSPGSLRTALRNLEVEGFTVRDPLTRRYLIRYPHPFMDIPQAVDDPLFYRDLVEAAFARTRYRSYALSLRPWGLHLEATAGNRGHRLWPFPHERKPVSAHAHASAGGRAILAYQRDEIVRAHLWRFPPKPYTSLSPSTIPEVMNRLTEVRRLGYARARGEIIPNRCGLAVPLRAQSGEAFGALGISLPLGNTCVFDSPDDVRACRRCPELAPVLGEIVEEIWRFSGA